MMKKNEFLDRLAALADITNKWRACHDDVFFSENYEKLVEMISDMLSYHHNFPLTQDEIHEIEAIIKTSFLDSFGISKFQRTTISNIETLLIFRVFQSKKAVNGLFGFAKRYNLKLLEQNSIFQIYFAIQLSINAKKISAEDLTDEEKNTEFNSLFSEHLSKINKELAGLNKAQLILTLLYSMINFIDLEDMVSKIDSDGCQQIKQYVKLTKNDEEFWTPFNRLIEFHLVKKLFRNDLYFEDTKLCHYTSLESLYYILKNKTIRFTKLNILNDLDENNLLNFKTKNDIFTFSLSFKKDSLDLFGNYTKMDGIMIEFENYALMQSFSNLVLKSNEKMSVSLFDFGAINYENDPQEKLVNPLLDKLKPVIANLLYDEDIDISINGAIQFINYFYKKKPWEYESEYRIAINLSRENLKMKIENAIVNEDSIDLMINPKRMIKSIVCGPKIKISQYKQNVLNKMLSEFGLENVPVTMTEANYKE